MHRRGYPVRFPAGVEGAHVLGVYGRSQSAEYELVDEFAVNADAEREPDEARLLHVGHAGRVVGVRVEAGLAHFLPGVAYPGDVLFVRRREPGVNVVELGTAYDGVAQRRAVYRVDFFPEVSGVEYGLSHVTAGEAGQEVQSLGDEFGNELEVQGGDVRLPGLEHSHAGAVLRHLELDERLDGRRLAPVHRDGFGYAAFVVDPFGLYEGACSDGVVAHPLLAHRVEDALGAYGRRGAEYSELAQRQSEVGRRLEVHLHGVVVNDARFSEHGGEVAGVAGGGLRVGGGVLPVYEPHDVVRGELAEILSHRVGRAVPRDALLQADGDLRAVLRHLPVAGEVGIHGVPLLHDEQVLGDGESAGLFPVAVWRDGGVANHRVDEVGDERDCAGLFDHAGRRVRHGRRHDYHFLDDLDLPHDFLFDHDGLARNLHFLDDFFFDYDRFARHLDFLDHFLDHGFAGDLDFFDHLFLYHHLLGNHFRFAATGYRGDDREHSGKQRQPSGLSSSSSHFSLLISHVSDYPTLGGAQIGDANPVSWGD